MEALIAKLHDSGSLTNRTCTPKQKLSGASRARVNRTFRHESRGRRGVLAGSQQFQCHARKVYNRGNINGLAIKKKVICTIQTVTEF